MAFLRDVNILSAANCVRAPSILQATMYITVILSCVLVVTGSSSCLICAGCGWHHHVRFAILPHAFCFAVVLCHRRWTQVVRQTLIYCPTGAMCGYPAQRASCSLTNLDAGRRGERACVARTLLCL